MHRTDVEYLCSPRPKIERLADLNKHRIAFGGAIVEFLVWRSDEFPGDPEERTGQVLKQCEALIGSPEHC